MRLLLELKLSAAPMTNKKEKAALIPSHELERQLYGAYLVKLDGCLSVCASLLPHIYLQAPSPRTSNFLVSVLKAKPIDAVSMHRGVCVCVCVCVCVWGACTELRSSSLLSKHLTD